METKLSSGKALGADAIPAEVYKAGGLPIAETVKTTEAFPSYPLLGRYWQNSVEPLECSS